MTTLLVATTGGHLAQLVDLADRITPGDDHRVWVTNRSPQSESLLNGADVRWVREVESRDICGVLRSVAHARRLLLSEKIDRVVSTGSGIALGYLPFLTARGVACHFIESAARVTGPSVTGQVLARTPGVRLYTQYPGRVDRRWSYRGCVFDGFEPSGATSSPCIRRVVVTIGTIPEQFGLLMRRLVELLGPDGELARAQGIAPQVLWQTGQTNVDDLGIDAVPFVPAERLATAMSGADLVVAHAGVGSALTSLRAGRCPVLVPRRSARGEIVDDHQEQVAEMLDRRGIAVRRELDQLDLDSIRRAASAGVRRSLAPPRFVLETTT